MPVFTSGGGDMGLEVSLFTPSGVPTRLEVLSQQAVTSHVPELRTEYRERLHFHYSEEFAN
jgi:hypothetical protein